MPQVAFIDTEGTFRPDRVRSISARYGLDADAVLENVCFRLQPTTLVTEARAVRQLWCVAVVSELEPETLHVG